MKKVIITLILAITGYINVYADNFQVYTGTSNETDEYIANINSNYYTTMKVSGLNKGTIHNCNANDTCTGNINYDLSSGGIVWKGSMANYGFDIAHDTLEMIATNHMYSYSYTFCVPGGVSDWNNRIYIGSGMGTGRNNQQNLIRFDYYNADNIEWLHYEQSGANVVDTTNCYTMYNLFNYTGSNANTIKVNLKTTSFTNKYIGFISYKLEDLGATNGLTSNQVQNIINNSGLASASSITEVQDSISEVQQELNGVNSSIEEQTQQQHEDAQAQIDSQKVCTVYNRNSVKETGKYLSYDGNTYNGSTWGITDYIPINQSTIKVLNSYTGTDVSGYCFYNSEKTRISCNRLYTLATNMEIPSNAYYLRTSIKVSDDRPIFEICKNGNQAFIDADNNYNTNPSENIEGKQEVDNMTEAENNLMDNLDFSGASELNISINPNSSNFIWDIVNRLRNMNIGIITLFTSILGLGIVKMILNR